MPLKIGEENCLVELLIPVVTGLQLNMFRQKLYLQIFWVGFSANYSLFIFLLLLFCRYISENPNHHDFDIIFVLFFQNSIQLKSFPAHFVIIEAWFVNNENNSSKPLSFFSPVVFCQSILTFCRAQFITDPPLPPCPSPPLPSHPLRSWLTASKWEGHFGNIFPSWEMLTYWVHISQFLT